MAKNIDAKKFRAVLEDNFGNIATAIAAIDIGDFTKNAFKRGYIATTLADTLEYKYKINYEDYASEEPKPLPPRPVKKPTPAEEEIINLLATLITRQNKLIELIAKVLDEQQKQR